MPRTKSPPPDAPAVIIPNHTESAVIEIGLIDAPITIWPINKHHVKGLAEAMQLVGQLQPIVVHNVIDSDRYQLAAGRHRLEALKSIGQTTIRAEVRPIADARHIADEQAIENLHQAQRHPLEQADALRTLLEYSPDTADMSPHEKAKWAAERVGWTVEMVRQRLQLHHLCERGRTMFAAGRMTLGQAFEISKLIDPAAQEAIIKDGMDTYAMGDEDNFICSVEELRQDVRHRLLSLADAPFELDVAFHDPETPNHPHRACNDCPCNTANDRGLFDDLNPKKPVCTDGACHAAKTTVTLRIAGDIAKQLHKDGRKATPANIDTFHSLNSGTNFVRIKTAQSAYTTIETKAQAKADKAAGKPKAGKSSGGGFDHDAWQQRNQAEGEWREKRNARSRAIEAGVEKALVRNQLARVLVVAALELHGRHKKAKPSFGDMVKAALHVTDANLRATVNKLAGTMAKGRLGAAFRDIAYIKGLPDAVATAFGLEDLPVVPDETKYVRDRIKELKSPRPKKAKAAATDADAPKKRGRPPGSKNKRKPARKK